MGPSPATVCPIMWVNQAQAWDDGYWTCPLPRISAAEEEILRGRQPGHAEKLPKGVIVPEIYMSLTKGPRNEYRHYRLGTLVMR